MARGRMINNKIVDDERFIALTDHLSRLSFVLLITFADRDGRVIGSPKAVAGMLFPHDEKITAEKMEAYLTEWADCGLIIWYEVAGRKYVQFPAFRRNQVGLRYECEAPSTIPSPLTPESHMVSQSVPQSVLQSVLQELSQEENRIEEKRSKYPADRESETPATDTKDGFSSEVVQKGIRENTTGTKQKCATDKDSMIRNLPDEVKSQFETFWKKYPAHRRVDKKRAIREWAKIGVTQEVFNEIMDGLARHLACKQWKEGIIPHISTWLHQERWKVELQPVKKSWDTF